MHFSAGPQEQQPQSQVYDTGTAHGSPPLLLLLGQVPVLPRLGLGQRQDAPLQQGGLPGQSGLQLDGCQPQLVAVLGVAEAGLCHVGGVTGVALGAGVAAVQGEVEQPEAGEAAVGLQAFGDALQAAHELLACRHMQQWSALELQQSSLNGKRSFTWPCIQHCGVLRSRGHTGCERQHEHTHRCCSG